MRNVELQLGGAWPNSAQACFVFFYFVPFVFCRIYILSYLYFVAFLYCHFCVLSFVIFANCFFVFCRICILSFCILSDLHFVLSVLFFLFCHFWILSFPELCFDRIVKYQGIGQKLFNPKEITEKNLWPHACAASRRINSIRKVYS